MQDLEIVSNIVMSSKAFEMDLIEVESSDCTLTITRLDTFEALELDNIEISNNRISLLFTMQGKSTALELPLKSFESIMLNKLQA